MNPLCSYPLCTRPAVGGLEHCTAHVGHQVAAILCSRRPRRPAGNTKLQPPRQLTLFDKEKPK